MATVFEDTITEEQRYGVHFSGQKDSMQKILIKKCFLFIVGSVFHVNRFAMCSRNSLKDVRKSQMMPDQVRKWLRQQTKGYYTEGFEELVKRWDKYISVGGGYVEKQMFHLGSNITYFITFYINLCPIYWLSLVLHDKILIQILFYHSVIAIT
jgi:hypothetical protein